MPTSSRLNQAVSVLIAMRVHLFSSRTQKLSSSATTLLGGRLPGKIGNANTEPRYFGGEVFYYIVRVDCDEGPPVSVCGARQKLRLTKQACFLPTAALAAPSLHPPPAAVGLATCWGAPAIILGVKHLRPSPTPATCSGRFICPRQRSHRSPTRTQKLSSSATTLLGGRRSRCDARCSRRRRSGFLAHRPQPLARLLPPATGGSRFAPPGKIGNANTSLTTSVVRFFIILKRTGFMKIV